jgi:glycyl-tRNA synthetase beta chain
VPADLLFELGSEELPASFLGPALESIKRTFETAAKEARLTHGAIRTLGSPRRLALYVSGVADQTPDENKDVNGPAAKAAFDAEGKPNQVAIKFAEKVGLPVEKLSRVQTPKGEYLSAKVFEPGKKAAELLPGILFKVAHAIDFKKSMRWGDVDLSYGRPLHWILALLGNTPLEVVFADVKSGGVTYGHRFLAPSAIAIKTPAEWEPALKKAQVVPDIAERKALVKERVLAAAAKAGGTLLEDEALLDQVTNLVELPNPVVGTFDERHLDLPPEVLVQEMKSHQRYFSLTDKAGKLLPKFIAVSNTPVKDEALSVRGYERVLRSRLSDGRFFFDEDRKLKLEARTEKLGRVVWQRELGTYAEKVERIRALALWLADQAGKGAARANVDRAATLCKADLVTGMVGEFPELQGVMGREYALASGESQEVALAIFEHYLPRNAGDGFPTQDPGALLGLADRLDSICGIFAIGKKPTGAADPFGLRRATLGFINITLTRGYRFSLSGAVDQALTRLAPKLEGVKKKAGEPEPREQVLDFFRARLKALWEEQHRGDVVEAVLSAGFDDLVSAQRRMDAMGKQVGQADFAPLAATFKRVANIVEKQAKDVTPGPVDIQWLSAIEEKDLHRAIAAVKDQVLSALKSDDYAGALAQVVTLKGPVDTFFDKVMVMAEDKAVRENRVRLLMDIGGLFAHVADFSRLQSEA